MPTNFQGSTAGDQGLGGYGGSFGGANPTFYQNTNPSVYRNRIGDLAGAGTAGGAGLGAMTGGGSLLLEPLLGLFGGKHRQPLPLWQRTANTDYAQGFGLLDAYNKLYNPTLSLAQRSASDYGDLYRRAANEQLSQNIQSASTTRAADLADYAKLSPAYYQALRAYNPQQTQGLDAMYQNLMQQAGAVNNPMSGAAQREVIQGSLGNSALHGFGQGPRDAALAYLSTGLQGEQLQQQRQSNLMQGLEGFNQQNNATYGNAFQALLNRPPNPTPAGSNVQSPNYGGYSNDLFSVGVNADIQRTNTLAAQSAANKQLIGNIVGGLLGSAGKIGAGML